MEIEAKAYSQVSFIITSMSPNLKSKIPSSVIELIENKKDKNYIITGKVKDLQLLNDTKKILCYLYTDYFANSEEKSVIRNKERIINNQVEKEKGTYQDIFEAKENNKEQNKIDKILIVKNEKWYIRILCKIKEILGAKK